jgi:hypothetical protein
MMWMMVHGARSLVMASWIAQLVRLLNARVGDWYDAKHFSAIRLRSRSRELHTDSSAVLRCRSA